MDIYLTEDELETLIEFIESELMEVIRRDTEIDSFDWLTSIVTANCKLKYELKKRKPSSESKGIMK